MLFYSASFQDIDLLRDSVLKWDLEMFPLELNALNYKITQVINPKFSVGEGDFACKTEQRGVTPSGFKTFVVPVNECVEYCWRGRKLKGNNLSLFPDNGELHSISNSTFHVYTVSFEHSLFWTACEAFESTVIDKAVQGENVWEVDKHRIDVIRELARNIILQSANNQTSDPLQQELLREILITIRNTEEKRSLTPVFKKHKTLKMATDWMRDRTMNHTPLSKLYQELAISERAAQIAFKDEYGLTLKAYYKKYRLMRVYQALKRAGSKHSVSDVAANYGFWHLGQFSKDYKNFIGELPSETLRGF